MIDSITGHISTRVLAEQETPNLISCTREQGRSCCIYFCTVVPPDSEMISIRLFPPSTQRWIISQPEPETSCALPPPVKSNHPWKTWLRSLRSLLSLLSLLSLRPAKLRLIFTGRGADSRSSRGRRARTRHPLSSQAPPAGSCPLVSGLLFWASARRQIALHADAACKHCAESVRLF